jgi:2-keto-4-pentenoate hydratase/2-oxohepta-3-ene-1,7-dioic acid hydratase in catechol pathway
MKIFGIGMNYLQHTEELDGQAYRPAQPVVFLKADSALLKDGKPFFVPDWCQRVDYEGELVVRICRLGKGIPERFAHRYYDAMTVGIDFTARDVQQQARAEGLPWAVCKGFDGSAAIGEWVDKSTLPPQEQLTFRLDKNGQTVQHGRVADMLFTVDQLVSYLSRFFTLKTGDLLFTGTPVGVGPVSVGDHLQGWIDNRPVLDFHCR